MPELEPLAYIPAEGKPPALLRPELAMLTRHGLIAGATGTGKTVSLQSLAERLSAAGVPVFLADAKGDLSGLAAAGIPAGPGSNPKIEAGLAAAGLGPTPRRALPAVFWDVFGERGHPLRATVSEMGPLLLGRALGLSETQGAVLSVLFQVADDRGLLLLDLKDLRALLEFCRKEAATLEPRYGRMSGSSLGAIQRALVVLEGQGGESFFGEPALAISELLGRDAEGRGLVHVLEASALLDSPSLYASFMLWLLSELFEELPEAGDLPAPKLVLFFDEAHLLFDGAPPELVRSVVKTVRLVRSKGVGVFMVTQNPLDLPSEVLGQLGNRVQHGLRAFSAAELRGLRAVAESFRPKPGLDAEAALAELAVGEALVSFLDEKGAPRPVERARIVPPLSRVGALGEAELSALRKASPFAGKYEASLDRPSAYEELRGQGSGGAAGGGTGAAGGAAGGSGPRGSGLAPSQAGTFRAGPEDLSAAMAALEAELRGEVPTRPASELVQPRSEEEDLRFPALETRAGAARGGGLGSSRPPARASGAPERSRAEDYLSQAARSAVNAAGRELGRQLVRGLLGGLSGGSRTRRRR